MRWLPSIALMLLLTACPSGSGGTDAGADRDAGADGGPGECVPPNTEHALLLNAKTTATVVHKTPGHPPLDGGLP